MGPCSLVPTTRAGIAPLPRPALVSRSCSRSVLSRLAPNPPVFGSIYHSPPSCTPLHHIISFQVILYYPIFYDSRWSYWILHSVIAVGMV